MCLHAPRRLCSFHLFPLPTCIWFSHFKAKASCAASVEIRQPGNPEASKMEGLLLPFVEKDRALQPALLAQPLQTTPCKRALDFRDVEIAGVLSDLFPTRHVLRCSVPQRHRGSINMKNEPAGKRAGWASPSGQLGNCPVTRLAWGQGSDTCIFSFVQEAAVAQTPGNPALLPVGYLSCLLETRGLSCPNVRTYLLGCCMILAHQRQEELIYKVDATPALKDSFPSRLPKKCFPS